MKDNKVIIILITVLVIVVITILGFLAISIMKNNKQPVVNQNVQNQNNNNQIEQPTNEEQNTIMNEPSGNMIIIEPNTNSVDSDNNIQPTESFVSNYYYNQLDDTAKTIYSQLKQEKNKFISGNHSVEYGTQFNTLLNSDGGQDKLTQSFQDAWDAFMYDNVDLFYIDTTKVSINIQYESLGGIRTYKVSIGPRNNGSYFLDTFKTQEEVEIAKAYMEDIRRQMTEQIATDGIYRKLGKVHNWLIETITYGGNTKDQHTIYGALANNKAVCEGYARAFKYLMDASGIPCILVSGTGTNSRGEEESHAWNYVQINENWYAVDVTWDDPILVNGGELTQELKYKYFLKGSEEFKVDHKEDGKLSEKGKTFRFPTISTQNYRP
ncbi:MAG: hypothetical protein HFJ29_05680 [Clostridia bacterium]|nr:hypothetical protein [Clostridia bacterium]